MWLWAAFALASASYWTFTVLLGWLALTFTGSVSSTALAVMPGFAFGVLQPFGGALADRVSRRRLLLAGQGLSCAAAAAFTLALVSGAASYWHVVMASAAAGLTYWPLHPARYALTMDLVGAPRLPAANALNMGAFTLGSLAPMLALALVPALGARAACILGLCWGIGALVALWHTHDPRTQSSVPPRPHRLRAVLWSMLSRPEGRAPCILTTAANVTSWPILISFPAIYAEVTFDAGAYGLALLSGATAAGAVAGSALLAMAAPAATQVRWHAAAFTLGTSGFGLSLAAVSVSPTLWLGVLAIAFAGTGSAIFEAQRNTLALIAAPLGSRAAALGVVRLFNSVMPLALAALGFTAEAFGVPAVSIACGALLTVCCAATWLSTPGWRRPSLSRTH